MPIFLRQNYLPPTLRFKPKNIILAGLFYGKKAEIKTIFFPIAQELESIQIAGLNMIYENKLYRMMPVISNCCCDLVERAKIQHIKGHSGYFCCPTGRGT